MSENSTACAKCPLETITHILENIKEDIGSLLLSSLVSHLWRQAALPLLFSTAYLRDEADFFRWQEIAQALPSVPLFVRRFVYEPGSADKRNLKQKYAVTSQACIGEIMLAMRKGAPSEDITIALPHMPGVVMLEWHTNMTQGIVCTSQVLQFLSPFVNITRLKWSGEFATVCDAFTFLGLFLQLEHLRLAAIGVQKLTSAPSQFTGDMTNLKTITIDECRSSLDWLVDHVLATSPPHDLHCIQYETDLIPFSPPAFSHLLDIVGHTIKKLVIQPPSNHDSKWSSIMCHPSYICSGPFMTKIPVFAARELPHLHALGFAIIFLGDRFKPNIPFRWCSSLFEKFPQTPQLRRLTINVYVADESEIDELLREGYFDWKGLVDRIGSFTSLEKFTFLVSMETEFGDRIKSEYEGKIKAALVGLKDKLCVDWCESVFLPYHTHSEWDTVDENPSWRLPALPQAD